MRIACSMMLWAAWAATAVNAWAQVDPIRWEPVNEPGGGGWIVSVSPSPHDHRRVLAGGDMLGLALSSDQGEHWTPTFGFASYEMCDITWHPTDPSVVWAGSLMGPYRSTDGGKTWRELRKGMPAISQWVYSQPIERILINPANPDLLLAFGGTYRDWGNCGEYGAVWESRDGGESWSRLAKITASGPSTDLTAKGVNITSAAYAGSSSTHLYIVAGGTVYVSEDAGKTWQHRAGGLPPGAKSRIAVHPANPDIAYLGCGNWKEGDEPLFHAGSVYQTTNAGRSWVRLSGGLAAHRAADTNLTSRYGSIAISPMDPNVLWTCDSAYNAGVIYKSEDGGRSWRPVASKGKLAYSEEGQQRQVYQVSTACPSGMALTGLVADPKDVNIAYGFGSEYILRTTDGGKTWIDVTSTRPDGSNPRLWRGRGWTGWCSQKIAFNPYKESQVILQAMDAGRGWISNDGFGTFRYISHEPNPWGAGKDTSFARDGHFYITTGQFGGTTGIICASNFGETVKIAVGKAHGLPEQSWGGANAEGAGIYAHPEKGNLVWAALGGRLYHSSDGGGMWRVVASRGFQYLTGDPAHPGRFYVTGKDGVYVTDDGKTLRNIGGPRPATRGRVTADAKGRVYVCQFRDGRPGLWRYTPATQNWDRLLDEPLAHDCAVDPQDPDRLILTTSQDPYHDRSSGNGLWISSDGGRTWSRANQDLPMLRVNAAAFDPFDSERIVVGTYGMGFFQAKWPTSYRPLGTRSYQPTAEDRTHVRVPDPVIPGGYHAIRDFGPDGMDYLYGKTWNASTVTAGSEGSIGYLQIDATTAGGGGVVLHGADLAPDGQTHLVLKVKVLPGNQARHLAMNIVAGGKAHIIRFDLAGLKEGGYETVMAPIGDLDASGVEQVQIAGTDFSDAAPRMVLRLDALGTIIPTPSEEARTGPLRDGARMNQYVTPDGNGAKSGKDFDNARPATKLQAALDAAGPGSTVYVGSGVYNRLSLQWKVGGAGPEAMVSLVGVDTGRGLPVFRSDFDRNAPAKTGNTLITVLPGLSHIAIRNLLVEGHSTAVWLKGRHRMVQLENIDVSNARDAFWIDGGAIAGQPDSGTCGLLVRDCDVNRFTKRGFRIVGGNADAQFVNCRADAGGREWAAEVFPIGFHIMGGKDGVLDHHITFTACTASRAWHDAGARYWNGDGFAAEGATRDLTWIHCVSFGNTDGGWDLKTRGARLVGCVSVGNKRNYRFWASGAPFVLEDCLSAHSVEQKQQTPGQGAWIKATAAVQMSRCTFWGDGTSIAVEDGDDTKPTFLRLDRCLLNPVNGGRARSFCPGVRLENLNSILHENGASRSGSTPR